MELEMKLRVEEGPGMGIRLNKEVGEGIGFGGGC